MTGNMVEGGDNAALQVTQDAGAVAEKLEETMTDHADIVRELQAIRKTIAYKDMGGGAIAPGCLVVVVLILGLMLVAAIKGLAPEPQSTPPSLDSSVVEPFTVPTKEE